MTGGANSLGIIAGSGDLPLAIAEAVMNNGRPIFILALEGVTGSNNLDSVPHAWISLGELGKALKHLRDAGCSEITFAGKVTRPEFSKMKLDAKGALALPRVMAAALKGDDAVQRAILGLFEDAGLRVIGADEVARDLLAPLGPLGEMEPTQEEDADILTAIKVVMALGALDIGQAAVVCQGLTLAVEAAEGTDAMLSRVATLPLSLRGTREHRRGVLVKAVKPRQDRRVDLPVIGLRTVELASEAGLAGIAIEGGASLIVGHSRVADAADRAGIFVYGFAPEDHPRG